MAFWVQCALGWIPTGTLVIVWRGTANFRNVITDIKFFSRKVHMTQNSWSKGCIRASTAWDYP